MVHIATDTTKPDAVGVLVSGQLDIAAVGAFPRGSGASGAGGSREPSGRADLGRVDFIDGCGLGMLIDAIARARRVGYELRSSTPRGVCAG